MLSPSNIDQIMQQLITLTYLINVLDQLVDVGDLEHDFRMIPDNGLQLEEDLQTLLVPL